MAQCMAPHALLLMPCSFSCMPWITCLGSHALGRMPWIACLAPPPSLPSLPLTWFYSPAAPVQTRFLRLATTSCYKYGCGLASFKVSQSVQP